MVKFGGRGTSPVACFLCRKLSRGSIGTLVKRDSTSKLRKGIVGSADSSSKVLRLTEFLRCAGENVPNSGVNNLARYFDKYLEKVWDWETMGL